MNGYVFSYDDMYLRPSHSSLKSRDDVDVSIKLCGKRYNLPVVSANMLDVISFENAKLLSNAGYFYIMHRFEGATRKFADFSKRNNLPMVSISVGVNQESKDDLDYVNSVLDYKVDWICVDTAHGDHDNVGEMIKYIQESYEGYFPRPKIIAGNVATAEGYKFLVGCGADAVKVSIGAGSICTTRYQTGFHLPTAYSVWECAQCGLDVPIIADGGLKYYGDIAKALVLGADMVMSGGWFASCLDSPAKIVGSRKIYRGSTSYEAKGQRKHIEGRTLELDEGIIYLERMEEIRQALASSISYAGGKDLSAFNHVEWHLL
jgi:GMP reductase